MTEEREYTKKQQTIKLYQDQLNQIDDLRWGLRYESRSDLIRELLDIGLNVFLEVHSWEGVNNMADIHSAINDLLDKDRGK